jgi:hypothetical protein
LAFTGGAANSGLALFGLIKIQPKKRMNKNVNDERRTEGDDEEKEGKMARTVEYDEDGHHSSEEYQEASTGEKSPSDNKMDTLKAAMREQLARFRLAKCHSIIYPGKFERIPNCFV